MTASDEELEKQAIEQDQYIDARAAEILNHDPDLVALYQRSKAWKLGAKALQGQLLELVESDEMALQVQNSIRNYKNVAVRMRELLPHEVLREGVATDCAEAIEGVAESLRRLAVELRKQISDLSPPEDYTADHWNAVEQAGLKALLDSMKKYRPKS